MQCYVSICRSRLIHQQHINQASYSFHLCIAIDLCTTLPRKSKVCITRLDESSCCLIRSMFTCGSHNSFIAFPTCVFFPCSFIIIMLKIFAHKKRNASILDLSNKPLSNNPSTASIYTTASFIPGEESPIIHVPKKKVPVNSSSPILMMPKPKHAIPPTQGVLDTGDKDKTELEEQMQLPEENKEHGFIQGKMMNE